MLKNLFKSLYPHNEEKPDDLLKRSNLLEKLRETRGKPLGYEFNEFIMFGSWERIKAVGELLLK